LEALAAALPFVTLWCAVGDTRSLIETLTFHRDGPWLTGPRFLPNKAHNSVDYVDTPYSILRNAIHMSTPNDSQWSKCARQESPGMWIGRYGLIRNKRYFAISLVDPQATLLTPYLPLWILWSILSSCKNAALGHLPSSVPRYQLKIHCLLFGLH
jgi:hypothetical protein